MIPRVGLRDMWVVLFSSSYILLSGLALSRAEQRGFGGMGLGGEDDLGGL